ncbi:hypothetical protein BHE74_00014522, partial [Ensete ventricosum]
MVSRAVGDIVISPHAGEDAGLVIISITISLRTCIFEHLGVAGGLAGVRATKLSPAAVLV